LGLVFSFIPDIVKAKEHYQKAKEIIKSNIEILKTPSNNNSSNNSTTNQNKISENITDLEGILADLDERINELDESETNKLPTQSSIPEKPFSISNEENQESSKLNQFVLSPSLFSHQPETQVNNMGVRGKSISVQQHSISVKVEPPVPELVTLIKVGSKRKLNEVSNINNNNNNDNNGNGESSPINKKSKESTD